MNYAHVVSGAVSAYPYPDGQLKADNSPGVSFGTVITDADRRRFGSLPVTEEPPEHDPRRQYPVLRDKAHWVVEADKVIATYTLHNRTLQERRDALIPRIEQMRWDKEVGGMIFNTMPIPTDDRAKTLIMGARTAAVEQGDAYSDEWKISPGVYVPLDATAAIALGDALLAHIRACFAREKALIQSVLDANTHNAMDEAEDAIETGWPE